MEGSRQGFLGKRRLTCLKAESDPYPYGPPERPGFPACRRLGHSLPSSDLNLFHSANHATSFLFATLLAELRITCCIRQFCKQHLHNWKCPKEVLLVETLPRNTMGKVLKEELKKLFTDKPARS